MAILLVRHGETELNRARVVQPPLTPLSALGHQQAQALGERVVREYAVVAVLASDMLRAQQSAAPAARRLGLTIESDADLAERNFGVLRGQAYDSLGFDPTAMDGAPEGGESSAQFQARVARAWVRITHRAARLEGDLLVVSHGLVVRRLLEHYLAPQAAASIGVGNASLTVMASEPPHALGLVACEAHLGAMVKRTGGGIVGV